MCKEVNLSHDDIDSMDIGGCIDYIEAYIAHHKKDKKPKVRAATQNDYDSF